MKITICIGSSCHVKGSRQVVRALQKLIADNKLEDKVQLGGTFCLSNCQKGVCVSPKSEGSGCAATDSAPNASALAIVFLVTARLLNAPQRRKAWRRHEP